MEALLKIIRDFILEKRMTADLLMQQYDNAKEQGELSATNANTYNRYKGQFDAYSYMCEEIEKFLDLIREVQSDE